MGIIAYELLLLGFISIYYQAEWFMPIKKYVMFSCLMSGGILVIIYMWQIEPSIEFTSIVLFVMSGFSWAMIAGRKTEQKIVHLPAQSYEVVAADNPENPDFQLVFLLKYEETIYNLPSLPPKEKPALILYTQKQKNEDIIFANFVIDRKGEPLTWKQRIRKMYNVLVFLVAVVLMPISFCLWKNGFTGDKLLDGGFMIMLGYVFTFQFKGNKSLFMRFFYYFGRLGEIVGWLNIFIELFLE